MHKSFFRVANLNHGDGLWYNRNGEFTGRIHKEFSFCKNHDLPMPYDESILGWLSATDTFENLLYWFTKEDILKLKVHGYNVVQYKCTMYREYENHWLIHPSGIIETITVDMSP